MITLTGRERHREQKSLFGKSVLVLQLEEDWEHTAHDSWGKPYIWHQRYWRDATTEDMTIRGEQK